MDSPINNIASKRTPHYTVKEFTFRILESSGEIREAKRLLYQCYVQEGEWDIPSQSASDIKATMLSDGWELTDKYSSDAVWFGAYYKSELIGCFRVLKQLELPGYMDIPEVLKFQSTELNRLAIRSDYRNHRVVTLMLLRTAFDYAFSLNPVVYVTAECPEPSGMFQRMGLIRFDFDEFKYHDTDPNGVDILYYDTRLFDRFSTSLYKMTSRILSK